MTVDAGPSAGDRPPPPFQEFARVYSACDEQWRQRHNLPPNTRQREWSFKEHFAFMDGKKFPSLPALRKIVTCFELTLEEARPLIEAAFHELKLGTYRTPAEIMEGRRHLSDSQLVANLRLANLLDLRTLAQRAGVSSVYLNFYEQGKRRLPQRHADKLINFLLPVPEYQSLHKDFFDTFGLQQETSPSQPAKSSYGRNYG